MSVSNANLDRREEAVAVTIERWLGNPVSRLLLGLVTGRTENGNRLDTALRDYIGEEISDDLDFRSKLASVIVRFIVSRGEESFGVSHEKLRKTLSDPIIRRALANVLEGVAKYGVRRPFTSSAPFLVVWNYTGLCNLNCKHCYEDSSPKVSTEEELTTEEAMRIIDEFEEDGVVAVAFSGGEPLMRDDIFEVAGYAKEKEFFVSIATNGTLIREGVAKKMSKVFDYAEISLDGFEDTHDEFRGVKGSWRRTCDGIRNSVAAGIDTCVSLTATHRNLDEIPELIDFVRDDLEAKKVIVFNYIPVRRGMEIADEDLDPDERMNLLRYLYSRMMEEDGPMTLYSTAPQYSVASWEYAHGPVVATHFTNQGALEALQGRTRTLAEFIGGCGAGRIYCGLEPNGDVEPCVFIPLIIGNLREQSLQEIWDNSEVLKKFRDRSEFEGCSECKYRDICGGCRARAYGYFHDLQGPDPGCPYNGGYWNELKKASLSSKQTLGGEMSKSISVSGRA